MVFGHPCSIFHCITRFVLTARDAISNAKSFCALQYSIEMFELFVDEEKETVLVEIPSANAMVISTRVAYL